MPKYLVIVESPAKVKTIKKFLGSNYEVLASNGHVRDLPKSRLGVDVEHDYDRSILTNKRKGGYPCRTAPCQQKGGQGISRDGARTARERRPRGIWRMR